MTSGMGEESGFERRARAVLEESLAGVDARTRSRLNRARQAALEAAAVRRSFWHSFGALPIAGAAAAGVLAVALTIFMRGPIHHADGSQPALEVLDMLADDESIALMENYDHSFYEWAAAQAETGSGDSSAGQTGSSDGEAGGGATGGAGG